MSEWHLKKIERRAHFYWGTASMPWVRYLTLQTFRRHHPAWRMTVWRPSVLFDPDDPRIGLDWWSAMPALDVEIKILDVEQIVPVDLSSIFSGTTRESIRSDYARAYLLSTLGGLWSDMDICYVRAIETAPFNCEENRDVTATMMRVEIAQLNCFLLSAPGSRPYVELFEATRTIPPSEFNTGYRFARVGNELMGQLWPKVPPDALNIEATVIDAFWGEPAGFDRAEPLVLPPDAIGVHWHGATTYGTWMELHRETFNGGGRMIDQLFARALE